MCTGKSVTLMPPVWPDNVPLMKLQDEKVKFHCHQEEGKGGLPSTLVLCFFSPFFSVLLFPLSGFSSSLVGFIPPSPFCLRDTHVCTQARAPVFNVSAALCMRWALQVFNYNAHLSG